jgi:microcystin synthetase protein McyG
MRDEMKGPKSWSDVAQRLTGLSPEKRALLDKRLRHSDEGTRSNSREPIAVIGMGCRFPGGADDPETFWKLLLEGYDGISEITAERWERSILERAGMEPIQTAALQWGGFLNDIKSFDPAFFNISPREADHMDPQQRLLLMTALEALEAAGLPLPELSGSTTGVYVGIHSMSSDYFWLQGSEWSGIDTYTSTGVAHSIVANRLSYCLDLKGPSLAVDTACSSSLVAVHLACQSLRAGECDLTVAGGVNLLLAPETSIAFSKLNFLAPDGRCKPFDEGANGFVRSEGCGVLVLKRLNQAIKNNDPILAVIRGSAINQDGASNGLTAPSGASQQKVIEAALKNGSISPADVSYVETHGTGTSLGDPIEIEALNNIYGSEHGHGSPCFLGAVKGNIGHLEGAAGIAGLIKTILCLCHKMVPPNIHFRKLNPNILLNNSRLRIPTEKIAWNMPEGARIGAVSSFGFGGTNAHILLQEYIQEPKPTAGLTVGEHQVQKVFLLPLSAKSKPSLDEMVSRWHQFLSDGGSNSFLTSDICYTASVRRTHHEYRIALTGRDKQELAEKLSQQKTITHSAESSTTESGSTSEAGLVFVFSGQGPQWFGMGRSLFEREPAYHDIVVRISSLLEQHAEWSLLKELTADEAHTRLNQTEIAQPAIFALQMGLATLWESWGIRPDAVVGHSIGEVAAACFSGVLSLEDAVRVVYHRGRLLQRAHGKGMMAAVGMAPQEAATLIAAHVDRLTIAAINSPASVTLSGDTHALNEVLDSIKGRDLFYRLLPVNYAFHSYHVESSRQEMTRSVDGIRTRSATIPIFSTVSGQLAGGSDYGPAYWAENIRKPVLFSAAVSSLIKAGHTTFVELSPHPVLNSSIDQCFSHLNRKGFVLASLRRGRDDEETMLDALGFLYVQNRSISWNGLFKKGGRCIPVPSYPWQKKRCWIQRERRFIEADLKERVPHYQESLAGELLMEFGWHPKRRLDYPGVRTFPHGLPGPEQIALHLRKEIGIETDGNSENDDEGILRRLDRLSAGYVVKAFQNLNWKMTAGDAITTEELAVRLGALKRHRRLLSRLLEILEHEGILRRVGADWQVVTAPADSDLESQFSGLLSQYPELDVEMHLFKRCAGSLAEVLSGKCDPLELIFSKDGTDSAEQLYQAAPITRVPNDMVRRAGAYIAEKLSEKDIIRILEIGAGTGGTTLNLLPALPAQRTEYIFSDVSSLFLEKAKRKLSGYPFVQYYLLDIEKDPSAQGLAPFQFDVVIASNVLHATADLRNALDHISRLLVPNGLMVLVEGVRPSSWVDMIFGQLEGWWRFSDTSLRSSYPLLSMKQWEQLIREMNFSESRTIPAVKGRFSRLFEQALILARSDAGSEDEVMISNSVLHPQQWLIFMDTSGIGRKIVAYLRSRGAICITVYPGNEFQKKNQDEVIINPSRLDDYGRLITEVCEQRTPNLERVVHLWSLDQPDDSKLISKTAIEERILRNDSGVLRYLQAFASSKKPGNPRLWIVTRRAQGVHRKEMPHCYSASTLWGLGRTAANEYSDLWGGLVDLDEGDMSDDTLEMLLDHIAHPNGNDQFAIRRGERYVPHLTPLPPKPKAPFPVHSDASYLITGGLGDLGIESSRWLLRQGARQLLLLNRTPLPPRSEWGSIEKNTNLYRQIKAVWEMESFGAEIKTASVDVTDLTQLSSALDSIKKDNWRPIRGIIHTASQFEPKLLQHMDEKDYRSGIRTKVVGALNLHTLFKEDELDFFVLYSSLNSLFGMVGLSSYAASNAFLDAFAHYRSSLGLPAISVNWGLWSGFGFVRKDVKLSAEDGLIQRGVESLDPEAAMDALGHLIQQNIPQGSVAKMNWAKFRQAFGAEKNLGMFSNLCAVSEGTEDQFLSREKEPKNNRFVKNLLSIEDGDQRRHEIESFVKKVIANLLRMEMNEIRRDKPLGELGLDSLMAVELKNQFEKELEIPLQATMAWNYPTVASLSEYISDKLGIPFTDTEPNIQRDIQSNRDIVFSQELNSAKLLENVDGLTDQEVFEKLMSK